MSKQECSLTTRHNLVGAMVKITVISTLCHISEFHTIKGLVIIYQMGAGDKNFFGGSLDMIFRMTERVIKRGDH